MKDTLPPAKRDGRARRVGSPQHQSLNGRLFLCASLIHRAETDLGPLDTGQKSDLLLDNFEWIFDSAEAHELLGMLEVHHA